MDWDTSKACFTSSSEASLLPNRTFSIIDPDGNDSYDGKGSFIRLDSISAIKAGINPSFVIYFDLDSQKVTPVYNNDTIEVVDTNWKLIKEYFDKQ